MKNELPVREPVHRHAAATPGYLLRLIITLAAVPLVLYLARPMLVDLMQSRALSYSGLARPGDARRVLDKALRLDSQNGGTWLALAYLYEGTGHNDGEALEAFRRSLALDPGNAAARFDLGMFHFWRREWAAAAEQLEMARGEGRDGGQAGMASRLRGTLTMLSRCYTELGLKEKAAAAAMELARRFPQKAAEAPSR